LQLTEAVVTAMKLTKKVTSLHLLVISKKMMLQTTEIKKFHNIFGVRDKLDWSSTEPCIQLTVKGPFDHL